MKTEMKCQLCKKEIETPDYGDGVLDYSDVYEYRGFVFHESCLDEGTKAVDAKRAEVIQVVAASVESQRNGEWQGGGYKNMKTDTSGKPITDIKEPQILKDYEKGIL